MASKLPLFGLAIDWETTGFSLPDYAAKHQGISFGAIIFDMKTFDPIEVLYKEIKYDPKYEWSLGAEKVHGLTREYLESNGSSQEEAALELCNLVVKYNHDNDIILLGHRVYFDKAFTKQLTESQGIFLNYHPTMIDSCSMGTVLLELSKSDEIFDVMGMPPRGAHNSLEDITYTLSSVKKMKEFFIKGLEVSLC